MSTGWRTGPQVKQMSGGFQSFQSLLTHTQTFCEGGWRNQKELYCQVCLHTQGICLGVRNFQYKKYKQCNKHIKKVVKIKTKQTIKKIDTKLHI